MRTIIHIGQHKTGTTSIQYYLKSRKDKLQEKGLFVPDRLAGYEQRSHFILNVYALNPGRFSSMKEIILAERGDGFFSDLRQTLEKNIAEHYSKARTQGCKDVIWSNEGLYLLNSTEEYLRLVNLFKEHSSEIVCICCFRETKSYQSSYIAQLRKQRLQLSDDIDSYRYTKDDSWLFDYQRKKNILHQVFDRTIFFDYDEKNIIKAFMGKIGYPIDDDNVSDIRLNVTDYTR